MCDPITAAGAALSGAGVLANQSSVSAVSQARNRVLQQQRTQQAELDTQAQGVQDHSLGLYKDFSGQTATRGQQLGDVLGAQNGAPPPSTATPASNSNIVNQESAKDSAKTAAYSGQQATALGNVRAFGDVLGDADRGQARDATTIGQIGNFKAGDAAVLPYQLDYASHAGDTLSTLGTLFGGAGKVGVALGLDQDRPGSPGNKLANGLFGGWMPTFG